MNLGMSEMIFIFLLALIIFGPKRLPEIGRQIGKALNDFKRASNEFKFQLEDEIRQLEASNNAPPAAEPVVAAAPENTIYSGPPTGPLTATLPPVVPRSEEPHESQPLLAENVAELTPAERAMHDDLAGVPTTSNGAAENTAEAGAAAAATSSSSSAGSNG
jgi:TatA/E family protein of Tat protein translocase